MLLSITVIIFLLSSFANYGIEQLYELLNDDPIVLMENLKNYMLDSYHNPGIIDQETLAALEYYTTD